MNSELELAWQLVQNTGCNVFLTGKAGTGKTTFLRNFCAKTNKRTVVLAPTGIAAINAQGSTLHSFFQLPFGPYIPGTTQRSNEKGYKFSEKKRRLIRSLDLVIIDEISMVRADLLDSVDAALRRFRDRTKPFGGVQLLLIGDLQQLAPVVKPEEWTLLQPYYDTQYFFSSLALKEAGYVTVELKKVYRQSEEEFIALLNKVRNNEADAAVLQRLNSRYIPGFVPDATEGYIRLTTHNRQADAINEREMDALPSEPHTYKAEIRKEFPELAYPTAEELTMKVGAQVMFVKNDSNLPKRYFNGMIGTVVSMTKSCINVLPQGKDEYICVTPELWENTRYNLNEKTKEIEEEQLGTFAQMPLKPAWAITVHKSQGLTFERAIIDVQYSFSHGQTYVALSRCKSLEGIVLSAPIPAHAIINDANVVAFTKSIPQQIPTAEKVKELERQYYLTLMAELFTFHGVRSAFDSYLRYIDEWLYRQLPETVDAWKMQRIDFEEHVDKVSRNFALQYQRMIAATETYDTDPTLQERCKKGATWFLAQMKTLLQQTSHLTIVTKNKNVAEREDALKKEFIEQLKQKILLLTFVEANGFDEESYLHQRALATLGAESKKTTTRTTSKKSSTKSARSASRKTSRTAAEIIEEALAEDNTYDAMELAELECDYPDLSHSGLPY